MAAQKIGYRIKAARKQLGITVDSLAEQIGKDRATVYRYENGEIENMPISTVIKTAEVLRMTISELLGLESQEKARPVAAGQGQGSKHDEILSPNGDSVKTTEWLTDFRVRRKMKGTEIVEAIRSLFPGFDKSLLSKVSSPEKYGICLAPEAIRLLKTTFEGEKDDGTA